MNIQKIEKGYLYYMNENFSKKKSKNIISIFHNDFKNFSIK
jgi:hypothetical protein